MLDPIAHWAALACLSDFSLALHSVHDVNCQRCTKLTFYGMPLDPGGLHLSHKEVAMLNFAFGVTRHWLKEIE